MSPRASRTEEVTGVVRTGDAYELIDELDDASVDLLISSPPYWGLRSYQIPHTNVHRRWLDTGATPDRVPTYDWYNSAGGALGMEPYPHWYVAHLVEFFNKARRVLQPTANLWVNLGDTYFARWSSIRDGGRQGYEKNRHRRKTPSGGYLHDKQLLMIPARFAIAMQDANWILRNDVIWSKPNVLPRPERDRLRMTHEHWFHFVLRRTSRRPAYFYDITKCEQGQRDVVSCAPAGGSNGHTATFPPDLIRPRIESSSPEWGTVLDPFCGTGRAVVESIRTRRHGIGFERNPAYARAARSAVRVALKRSIDVAK
jgi:DNA modification methylase